MNRCQPCTDGDHEHCATPLTGGPTGGFSLGCCCDLIDFDELATDRLLEQLHYDLGPGDQDPADV